MAAEIEAAVRQNAGLIAEQIMQADPSSEDDDGDLEASA